MGLNTKLQRHQFTPEEDAYLGRLLKEGLSHAQIGVKMDMTKGAICGRANRLGLHPIPRPLSAARARRRARDKERIEARAQAVPKGGLRQVQYGRVSACQWIDGDVLSGSWTMCGESVQHGSSYCPPHHQRCYKKLEETGR